MVDSAVVMKREESWSWSQVHLMFLNSLEMSWFSLCPCVCILCVHCLIRVQNTFMLFVTLTQIRLRNCW